MSHSTDGAEVLALWSNGGLTGRHRGKKRCQPLKRAAKGKQATAGQQLALDSPKPEGQQAHLAAAEVPTVTNSSVAIVLSVTSSARKKARVTEAKVIKTGREVANPGGEYD
jgi:hypothetical protein